MFVGLVIYRELRVGQLYAVFINAAKTTSVVLFLVASALVTSWLITRANIPADVGDIIQPLIDRPQLLMLVIVL